MRGSSKAFKLLNIANIWRKSKNLKIKIKTAVSLSYAGEAPVPRTRQGPGELGLNMSASPCSSAQPLVIRVLASPVLVILGEEGVVHLGPEAHSK